MQLIQMSARPLDYMCVSLHVRKVAFYGLLTTRSVMWNTEERWESVFLKTNKTLSWISAFFLCREFHPPKNNVASSLSPSCVCASCFPLNSDGLANFYWSLTCYNVISMWIKSHMYWFCSIVQLKTGLKQCNSQCVSNVSTIATTQSLHKGNSKISL